MLVTTAAALLACAVPSYAATTEDPAEAGAGWIASKLVGGNHLEVTFDGSSFPDYGLTADAVFAFDAASVAQAAASRATDYLKANVGSYVGDGTNESYAGALAKLVNVAAAQGVDPTSFGGRDLVAELSALECGTPSRTDCPAGDTGRFSDKSAFGNFSNGIGQSLALIGLERTTSTGPSAASVTFLIGQQCDDGGFPEVFNATTCTSSVDTTGFAAQALLLAGPAAAAAAQDAIAFLKSLQNANGSFTGNGSDNSNTTALAAQALTAAGESAAAADARQFITSLQSGCSASSANRGKIAYDANGGGDDLRASTQAVPALAGVPLGQITSDGAEAEAPTLECAAAGPTTTPGATTPPGTGGGTGAGNGGAGQAGGGARLANTGGMPGPAVAGGVLLLIGTGLVLLARRRALPS
jgi:hypothetical protein